MNYAKLWGTQPIIIIGMHRSGTTMLTRLLEQAGLFVGRDLCPDTHESRYFQRVNDWILQQPGASWDNPEAMHYLWDDTRSMALARAYVARQLCSLPALGYFGGFSRIGRLGPCWGWKDPRTTYTLPLWRSIFPEAKVLYIARHGVDCAKSLQFRKNQETGYLESKMLHHPTPFRLFRRSLGRLSGRNLPTPRCNTLEGGFSLWESYVDEAQRQLATIQPQQKMILRYEDLADDFTGIMRSLFAFLQLAISDEQLATLGAQLQLDRMYAHRKDPQLRDFAEARHARLEARGY